MAASFLEYVPSDMADIGSELEISVDVYPPQPDSGSAGRAYWGHEGIPEWLPDGCDAAVYAMGDGQAICDELTCSDFDLGNTDSESESDDMLSVDDGDQVAPGARVTLGCGDTSLMTAPPTACLLSGPRCGTSLSPGSREDKNERERVRIIKKREKLKEAKSLAIRSSLIDDESKKHRWTEEYTLKQLRRMIAILEGKFKKYNRVPHTPRPLARKAAPRGSRRPPNSFLRFSQALRPSFLAILKTYLHPGKSKGELQHIPVSSRLLLQGNKSCDLWCR